MSTDKDRWYIFVWVPNHGWDLWIGEDFKMEDLESEFSAIIGEYDLREKDFVKVKVYNPNNDKFMEAKLYPPKECKIVWD